MIRSFRGTLAELLFSGNCPARLKSIRAVAERKLQMLDSAQRIDDLRTPPGNRLESLTGNRRGTWSIRVNDRWRVCFVFEDGDAFDVEIVDYH